MIGQPVVSRALYIPSCVPFLDGGESPVDPLQVGIKICDGLTYVQSSISVSGFSLGKAGPPF
jgi:hypothetical protein